MPSLPSKYLYKAPPPKHHNWWAGRIDEPKTLQEGLFAESRPIVYAGTGEKTHWDGQRAAKAKRDQKNLDALALDEMRRLTRRKFPG